MFTIRSLRFHRAWPDLKRLFMVIMTAAFCLTACSSSSSQIPRSLGHLLPLTKIQLANGADHACIVPGSKPPTIDWSALHNPILSYPNAGVKDQALIWALGKWHMLFSYMTTPPNSPGGVTFNVATATSPNLTTWSAPDPWPTQRGIADAVSPDIVRDPAGDFVATYQGTSAVKGPGYGLNKLYYRISSNLISWSKPYSLAHSIAPLPTQTSIDPALAFTGNGVFLGTKITNGTGHAHFEIAWSPSGSLNGPWQLLGRANIVLYNDTVENYEFVLLQGKWHLIATSNILDQPWIFTLAGNPNKAINWLHWTDGYEVKIPSQPFNTGPGLSSLTFEHANSAFLCDAHALDGYYYMTYSASTELTAFGGWGHARIGIARSKNLKTWQVPSELPQPLVATTTTTTK